MPSNTKLKNAAIAAKTAVLPSIPQEPVDQFVSGPMTGGAVNAATMASKKVQLSGGEQKILAFARSLVLNPELLILDEPSQGPAPLTVEEVMNTVAMMRGEGVAILLAEQNAKLVLKGADRAYVLSDGAVVYAGSAAELGSDHARMMRLAAGARSEANRPAGRRRLIGQFHERRVGVRIMSQDGNWIEATYRVQTSAAVTPVIRELWLAPTTSAVTFRAGQYVLLGDTDWRVPQRSYSVANAPRADGAVSILVTRVEGGPTSTWAHGLHEGDEVLLEGPFGTFVSAADRTGPALLLGAGSGLAPVRALAEDLLAHAPQRFVTLFFSCRTRADLIGHERFQGWQRERSDFRYLHTLTRDPAAPLHARVPALLAETVGRDLTGWEVFTSGPSGFVVGCSNAAQALGALATDIHSEEFFTDPQPWMGDMPPVPEGGTTIRETP